MSGHKGRSKQYCDKDIAKALAKIKKKTISTSSASKKYNIPESTLRGRLKAVSNGKKNQYHPDTVIDALADIRNNSMPVYAAAKKYKIPASTLRDRLKGYHNKGYGSSKVLSDREEAQLAEWVILCSRTGYPKSKRQILKTAGELSKLNSTKTFVEGTPTSGWFRKFIQRNPEVAKRTPEPLGRASASITPENVKKYFALVETQFKEAGRLDLLNKPESWWNVDETSFEMNPTPKNVYAEKGVKTVHIVEKGKTKENITCTYAVCGDGKYVPPLVTFKETFSNLDLAAYVSKGKMNV